jgi:hypothetical protein
MTFRIQDVHRVIDSGMKFRWKIDDLAALLFQEAHGVTQLRVAADLESKAHELAVAAEAKLLS